LRPAALTDVAATLFLFFAFFFVFTIVSGLAALITGFSSQIANRIFPIAFMLSIPGLVSLIAWIGKDETMVDLTEGIIIVSNFNDNVRMQDPNRSYPGFWGGTKICRDLPIGIGITPHSDTGYITATPRLRPPRNPANHEVPATKYIYGFVEQKDCPAIQEWFDDVRDIPSSKSPTHE
jgi:hypothetical protein